MEATEKDETNHQPVIHDHVAFLINLLEQCSLQDLHLDWPRHHSSLECSALCF